MQQLHLLMNTKVEKSNNKFIRGMDHCTLKNMNVFKTIANLATLSTSYKKKIPSKVASIFQVIQVSILVNKKTDKQLTRRKSTDMTRL